MKIGEMEVGRELDALIAEKVMGWEKCFTPFQKETDAAPKGWIADKDGVWTSRISTPKFSEDIEAAWEIAKKLCLTIFPMPSTYADMPEKWIAGTVAELADFTWSKGVPDSIDFYFGACAIAETAPLAICRAALGAMERIEKE